MHVASSTARKETQAWPSFTVGDLQDTINLEIYSLNLSISFGFRFYHSVTFLNHSLLKCWGKTLVITEANISIIESSPIFF